MNGAYLGPVFSSSQVKAELDTQRAVYEQFEEHQLITKVAKLIEAGRVVGWFRGRMEFGPRALCNRSIIGDARNRDMQTVMNLKIKFRESFRPFAPVVKEDKVSEWFDIDGPSPYMLLVAPIAQSKQLPSGESDQSLQGLEKLAVPRSVIPAVTHVDSSARVQTIHADINPDFYRLLDEFERNTGCPVLVNTSFNVRGEPIVNSPEDAYRCFMRTEMDYLVVEDFLLAKKDQPEWSEQTDWAEEFELD